MTSPATLEDVTETAEATAPSPSLAHRIPTTPVTDGDAILERFLDWVAELGFDLFPAQEEALLEVMEGRHVILNTPTGSGKSLVAAGVHFRTLCRGGVSYYTSPIKALASEKFFDLCQTFGPERVGMLTGDASINPEAPVICCTAEVLSNLSLRYGADLRADSVVMDEFHYYADRDRGVAWQIPLVTMPNTVFTLMSATLGNPAPIRERLEERSGRRAVVVASVERPVPLTFEYRETPLQDTVQDLVDGDRAPVYVVNFTQRDCAELAQALTSLKLASREHREKIWDAVADFRFDTAYGKDMKRFVGFGIGVHHAGLLPKYRLLVEQLAQQGLLKVICGTDTLGVGVNIPLRTVLFRQLCKYDGQKVAILSVRDFQQIAGRAGRKGFDDRGYVICQAPAHEIENQQLEEKARKNPKKAKKLVKSQPPQRGYVHWDEKTFRQLIDRPSETLKSKFWIDHGILLNLIQQDVDRDDPEHGNFHSLRELIRHCHEDDGAKAQLVSDAAQLVRALHRAGVLRMVRDTETSFWWVTVDSDLQIDFSLYQTLALFLVETLPTLDKESEDYALDVLSLVEAILENPELLLRRQQDKIRDELYQRLKAERVPYEERQRRLEETTYPKPNAERIYEAFNRFRGDHPWVIGESIRPKGIGREFWVDYLGFEDFVRRYGVQRSEGLLLRYLSQLFKTLAQTVPDEHKTEEVWDLLGFFRAILARVDNSLIQEWENLLHPEIGTSRLAGTHAGDRALESYELLDDPRAFAARIRAELHHLQRALAAQDWEEAALSVWQPSGGDAERDDDAGPAHPEAWDADRFAEVMAPYFEEYGELPFTPESRQSHLTHIEELESGRWRVLHTLLDPMGDDLWGLEAEVEIHPGATVANAQELGLDRPLLRLRRIGP